LTQASTNSEVRLATQKQYIPPALDKGLDIIELLAENECGLGQGEIARRLHRTVSEIFRMLQCLTHKGFVNKSENGRYSLSLRLFELAWMHPPAERLIHESQPVMQWLAGQTQQACYLSVLNEGFVSVVAEASPPCGIGFCVKPGATVNLMDATSGYVILAYQSKDVIDQIVADWRRAIGQQTPSDLRSRLMRIQERGFEESSSPEVRGVIDISFPIRDLNGSAAAALSISYLRRTNGHSRIDQVRTRLREASEKISMAIGGGPFPCALEPAMNHAFCNR